jgi:adenylate kinase family enzyme
VRYTVDETPLAARSFEVGEVTRWGPRLTRFDSDEVVRARADQASYEATIRIRTPERVLLREQCAEELYSTGAARKERRAYIVIGPPGAGKTTARVTPLKEQHGALEIDSDLAKALLPGYAGGRFAGLVHEESDEVIGLVLQRAARAGDNLVIAIVGRTPERALRIRDLLRRYRYEEVHLELVDLPPEEAAKRAVERFQKGKRFVDPDYVLNQVGDNPSRTYEVLREEGGFDSYAAYSNAVPEGQPPAFLADRSDPRPPDAG